MQIARQHTRFFRQVYDNPKQSDILCGINIRIHIASAILALKRLVVSCPGMLALVASLRSICRWNDNQLDSGKFALVGKELPKLTEIPRIEFCFKGLVSPFGCFANVFQVLNGYAGASLSGFGNNILGNGMVDYHCSGLFSPFKPFQKSGASTLALPCSAFCAFGLNRTTYFSLFFPISVKRVGRIGFTIRSAYNVGYAKIKSDKILNVFDLFFRNFNRLKEENRALKQAALEKEKALVKYAREYILMGDECLKHDMKEAAMKNYEKAVTLCPKFKEAWKKIKKLEKEMLKR